MVLVQRRRRRTPAVVKLWGRLEEPLDADRIQRWSTCEPVGVLFVGITVSKFQGTLAFKLSQPTQWYVNPTPDTAAVLERLTTR